MMLSTRARALSSAKEHLSLFAGWVWRPPQHAQVDTETAGDRWAERGEQQCLVSRGTRVVGWDVEQR